ncbi:hypothetical protein [Wenzhouxiangella sediminis]|uniref:hypothetical protein n=1 Tax=Wenzhouxiangella sediminis TaxID=1792836 RepID=UPI0011C04647|nr:hypothetical protein [Wenzhouxiangella sediminis]
MALDFDGLVRVVLKLFGLVLAVYGISTLAAYAPLVLSSSGALQLLNFLSGPAVFIGAGLFLWFFPAPISNTVIRGGGEQGEESVWVARLVEAGSVLIGLWLFVVAISDLVFQLLAERSQAERLPYEQGPSEFGAYVSATLVELALALFLIFGARGIAVLVRRVRYGGLETSRRQ